MDRMKNFKKIYDQEIARFSDCYTELHETILNHSGIRTHCYAVCKRMIEKTIEEMFKAAKKAAKNKKYN
jgi:hypothetical protein